MTPFQAAYVDPDEVKTQIQNALEAYDTGDPVFRKLFPEADPKEAHRLIEEVILEETENTKLWLNDLYQVSVRHMEATIPGEPGLVHLSIKRLDRQPVHDWRDLQQIKTELVGPECEGVELYPAESRIVDTANQYHLWVIDRPGVNFPFGFQSGRVLTDKPLGKAINRPRQTVAK